MCVVTVVELVALRYNRCLRSVNLTTNPPYHIYLILLAMVYVAKVILNFQTDMLNSTHLTMFPNSMTYTTMTQLNIATLSTTLLIDFYRFLELLLHVMYVLAHFTWIAFVHQNDKCFLELSLIGLIVELLLILDKLGESCYSWPFLVIIFTLT